MRSNRLSQSPEEVATPHRAPDGTDRSYPQARPSGNDDVSIHAIDHHELLAAGRPGDDPDVSPGDAELVRQQPHERVVGRPLDSGSRDPCLQDALQHALDSIERGARGEAYGEADVRWLRTSGGAAPVYRQ